MSQINPEHVTTGLMIIGSFGALIAVTAIGLLIYKTRSKK